MIVIGRRLVEQLIISEKLCTIHWISNRTVASCINKVGLVEISLSQYFFWKYLLILHEGVVFNFHSNNFESLLLASFYWNHLLEIICLKLSTKKNWYVGYLAFKIHLWQHNTLSFLEVDLQQFTWKIFQLEIESSFSLEPSPFSTIYIFPDMITPGYHLLPIYLV